jgi:hypothetical protein
MANLSDGDVKVAYALQLMREQLEHCKPMKCTASLDGKDISGEYLLFEAMNTRYIGPNLFLAPNLAHRQRAARYRVRHGKGQKQALEVSGEVARKASCGRRPWG